MLQKLLKTDANYASLVMRLALGIMMFPHGAGKALGWFGGGGWSATIQAFGGMGLPAALTILIILGEFLGSIGLILGCFTRLAAGGVGLIMTGAVVLVHWKNGFFMNWFGQQAGEGFEFHILAIGLALGLIILGGGALSLDHSVSGKK